MDNERTTYTPVLFRAYWDISNPLTMQATTAITIPREGESVADVLMDKVRAAWPSR